MSAAHLAVAAAGALVIGIVLGLVGGGGSILTVPFLVYGLGLDPKPSIVTSLFLVSVTSLVGMISHARTSGVRWRTGGVFGAAGMLGAYAGGAIAHRIDARWLLVGFALLMLATSLAMIRGRGPDRGATSELSLSRALPLGTAVGAIAGTVGAGGGFLIVPSLTLFGGLQIRQAISTSLFVLALQSAAGFVGHAMHVRVPWDITLSMTLAATFGSLAGARASVHVAPSTLRRLFGFVVLLIALFMIQRELSLLLAAALLLFCIVATTWTLRGPARASS